VLGAILLAGCGTVYEPKFNRPDGVGSDSVLFVPFSEPRSYRWYGESSRGETVATSFETWVMIHGTPNFSEGQATEDALRIIRDWNRREIEFADWIRIAQPAGVKYLVVGEIEKISLSSPGNVGVLDASLIASFRVIDVEKKMTVWRRESYPISLGRGGETDAPVISIDIDQGQIERKLLVKLGEQIGKDLYGYEEEFQSSW
jgi:hypothetical protein